MRADIRSGKAATTRRTQPNWVVECIKAGIPLSQLPAAPSADASFKEKSQYTWELRKAWQRKTGRTIERLTPPGYNDKILERRRAAREARKAGDGLVDHLLVELHLRDAADLEARARREADDFIAEDIRQAEPFTQIDTRVGDPTAERLSRTSPTVPEGYRWVRDGDLSPEKAEARQASITTRFASGAIYVPAGG